MNTTCKNNGPLRTIQYSPRVPKVPGAFCWGGCPGRTWAEGNAHRSVACPPAHGYDTSQRAVGPDPLSRVRPGRRGPRGGLMTEQANSETKSRSTTL